MDPTIELEQEDEERYFTSAEERLNPYKSF